MNTQELNLVYKWGRFTLVALVVFLAVSTLGSLKTLKQIDPVYNSITVSGEGEIFAKPDVASFSFSVSANADTVEVAQGEVTKKMDSVLASIKALGIEDKDVKTTDYSIWPNYVYESTVCTLQYPSTCPPSRQVQKGYTVNHSVSVKIRNTEKSGEVLSAAGKDGVSNLSGLSFTVDDLDKIRDDARTMAIEQARKKAESLSKALGVKLVRVVSYSDGSDLYPMPYYAEAMGGDGVVPSKAPSLPTGENQIRMVVNVTYEIR